MKSLYVDICFIYERMIFSTSWSVDLWMNLSDELKENVRVCLRHDHEDNSSILKPWWTIAKSFEVNLSESQSGDCNLWQLSMLCMWTNGSHCQVFLNSSDTIRRMAYTVSTVQQHNKNTEWRSWGRGFEKQRSTVNLACDLIDFTKQRKKKVERSQWLKAHGNSKKQAQLIVTCSSMEGHKVRIVIDHWTIKNFLSTSVAMKLGLMFMKDMNEKV